MLAVGDGAVIVHVRGAVVEADGACMAAGEWGVLGEREVRGKDESQGCQSDQDAILVVHDSLRSHPYDAGE